METIVLLEYKYDGERIQIHVLNVAKWMSGDDSMALAYSRSGDVFRSKYLPSLFEKLKESITSDLESFIIEGEVVAVDRRKDGTMSFLPFQVLMTNANKHVNLFVFDLLYRNGKSYMNVGCDIKLYFKNHVCV